MAADRTALRHLVSMILPLLILADSPSHAQSSDADDGRVHKGRDLALSLGRELKVRLSAALNAGGPVEAIEVCQLDASAIASRLSAESGARVGRTSLRVRNPANAPDDWERRTLEEFESRLASGESPATLEALSTSSATSASVRYMKAIITEPLCLTCHGDTLAPAIAAAIAQRYPDDEATGFEVGTLRGAFTVEWSILAENTQDAAQP